MLRTSAIGVSAIGRAGLDRRRRRAAAAVLTTFVAFSLSGCSSTSSSGGSADTPWTSRFTGLFSGSGNAPAQVAAGTAVGGDDCPNIDVRVGAGTYSASENPGESSMTGVRYQATLTQLARQCTTAGGNLIIKVGVQGRIILGPAGDPGPVELPLRYAVVQEGVTEKTIATEFKRVAAEVPPGQSNVTFSNVDESLSIPMPPRAELAGYMIYVGFDEIGDAPEKKPAAKKPAPKRK